MVQRFSVTHIRNLHRIQDFLNRESERKMSLLIVRAAMIKVC